MNTIHFLNGQLVSEEDLLISPRDLGYARGYAVFEFMIISNGRPFMLERHLERLYRSCKEISMNLPWSKEKVTDWIMQTIKANKSVKGEKVIRITISGGLSLAFSQAKMPTIVMMVDPRIPSPPEDYANGVHVLLSEYQRYKPQAKTNNYIEAVRLFSSIPKGIDDIIYHSKNMVREGTKCNIFAVINGSLMTPKTGILGGVTRDVIINELDLSVPAKAKDFSVHELLGASEVFITATGKQVMPVTKINNTSVGDGLVGPVTKETMSKFRNFFESDLW